MLVAKRLRNKFNTSNLGPASLSMGMAQLEGGLKTLEQDLETLLRTADQHLYLAKNNGGDQICTANQDSHLDNPPLNTSNYQQG
jgi:GGDEF domain-containing protein